MHFSLLTLTDFPFRSMVGSSVPDDWIGGLGVPYKTGPGHSNDRYWCRIWKTMHPPKGENYHTLCTGIFFSVAQIIKLYDRLTENFYGQFLDNFWNDQIFKVHF